LFPVNVLCLHWGDRRILFGILAALAVMAASLAEWGGETSLIFFPVDSENTQKTEGQDRLITGLLPLSVIPGKPK
jgi:hypothetical protein